MSELDQLNQSQAARRMNLAEWRASRLHEIDDMPSGLPVVVRDVGMQDMVMMEGVEIPNVFLDMLFDNEEKQVKGEPEAKKDGEVILEMMRNKSEFNKMLNEVVKFCLVEPKIGEQPDGEHITLDELNFADKMHLFNFLNREALAVQPFRNESDAPEAAQPGGSVRDETIGDAELADRMGSVPAGRGLPDGGTPGRTGSDPGTTVSVRKDKQARQTAGEVPQPAWTGNEESQS